MFVRCISRFAKPCLCLQFVADGVFYAELNELFTRELAEHGYSGVEVRVTPLRTEIIIRATRTQNVLGRASYPDLVVEILALHTAFVEAHCISQLSSGPGSCSSCCYPRIDSYTWTPSVFYLQILMGNEQVSRGEGSGS